MNNALSLETGEHFPRVPSTPIFLPRCADLRDEELEAGKRAYAAYVVNTGYLTHIFPQSTPPSPVLCEADVYSA